MSLAGFEFFLRWWHEELVRALLWGVWRHVLDRKGSAQDAAFARFQCLVNEANCWPCYISYCHPARNVPLEDGGWAPPLVICGPTDYVEDFS